MSISRMCLVNPGPILFPLTDPMIALLNCCQELALQEVDSSHCQLQRGRQWMFTFLRHWRMDLGMVTQSMANSLNLKITQPKT